MKIDFKVNDDPTFSHYSILFTSNIKIYYIDIEEFIRENETNICELMIKYVSNFTIDELLTKLQGVRNREIEKTNMWFAYYKRVEDVDKWMDDYVLRCIEAKEKRDPRYMAMLKRNDIHNEYHAANFDSCNKRELYLKCIHLNNDRSREVNAEKAAIIKRMKEMGNNINSDELDNMRIILIEADKEYEKELRVRSNATKQLRKFDDNLETLKKKLREADIEYEETLRKLDEAEKDMQ